MTARPHNEEVMVGLLVVGLLVGMVAALGGCQTAGRALPDLFSGDGVDRLTEQAQSPDQTSSLGQM